MTRLAHVSRVPRQTAITHTAKEHAMTATTTHITGIRTVSIPVGDQDAALEIIDKSGWGKD